MGHSPAWPSRVPDIVPTLSSLSWFAQTSVFGFGILKVSNGFNSETRASILLELPKIEPLSEAYLLFGEKIVGLRQQWLPLHRKWLEMLPHVRQAETKQAGCFLLEDLSKWGSELWWSLPPDPCLWASLAEWKWIWKVAGGKGEGKRIVHVVYKYVVLCSLRLDSGAVRNCTHAGTASHHSITNWPWAGLHGIPCVVCWGYLSFTVLSFNHFLEINILGPGSIA